jgi:ADP-dependent NAD(P)H-hydrate dehydratase / NAD(P)H-hydrate epimerase
MLPSVPILSCAEALAWEQKKLPDEGAEWHAMLRAGFGMADGMLRDFAEIGPLPPRPRILALVGKGHNGGDALLATERLLNRLPEATALIVLAAPIASMRPLAQQALRGLAAAAGERLETAVVSEANADRVAARLVGKSFAFCLDGLLGMQFRPPLRSPVLEIIRAVQAHPDIALRAAVDLPSGIGDESDPRALPADFTYATGIAKQPALQAGAAVRGRLRFVDLGFFQPKDLADASSRLLLPGCLDPLRRLRPAGSDKRSYGHLFILAGSRSMPGALLMAARAALRSGVGLLTVFAPESVAALCAPALPEAMWVPFPETPTGGLALEGKRLLLERADRASALLVGPGTGRERETQALLRELVEESSLPAVIDADALQPELLERRRKQEHAAPMILTPHAGEYQRLDSEADSPPTDLQLKTFAERNRCVVALKGPLTRICSGGSVWVSPYGGPVLARGGSGDVLAGMAAGLLAQSPEQAETVACQAVVWHGLAAVALARSTAPAAARATDLIESFSEGLRLTLP